MLMNDSGADIIPEDSSSDEDLIQSELDDANSNDPDYQISSQESDDDDDYKPPRPSTSAQPPQSPGRSSCCASAPALPQPVSSEKHSPAQTQPSRKAMAKRRRSVSADVKVEEEEERWHSRQEEDQKPDPLSFRPARSPGPTFDRTAAWSPLLLFQLFFSKSVVQTIIDNTNANAAKRIEAGKKFVWKALTVNDFYIFMAIIIFSGLVHVHHRADYWKRQWPYNFSFPHEKMSRNRFETILWSLHLSNPKDDEENDRKKNTADYDRLFKIKPLYTDIVTACKAVFHPYQNISIDERMVASKARNSMKQYMKEKPTKWGYKLFVLADSSKGYTWNFSVYMGKSEKSEAGTIHGLSYTSVIDLLPFSVLGGGYTLYVDNFYTSPALFRDLYKRDIGCCGTIRKNHVDFPRTGTNDFPKKPERGDIRWIRKDSLLFVKWIDTREVTLCSTVHKAFSGKTVQRRVKEAGVWTAKAVPVPDVVMEYNKNMGGVDLSDALIGYYSVHHKTMKWYKTFFYHFVDIAVVNSFILHKELFRIRSDPSAKAYTQKTFREALAAEMLDFAEASSPRPSPKLTCMPRYYGSDATESRRYCRRCLDAGIPRVKTPIYCRNCNVPLCLTSKKNCFQLWHDTR